MSTQAGNGTEIALWLPARQETGPPERLVAGSPYNGAPNENIVCIFSPS